jgi:hypothetical protein
MFPSVIRRAAVFLSILVLVLLFVSFELVSELAPFLLFPGCPSITNGFVPLRISETYNPVSISDTVREGILKTRSGNTIHFAEFSPDENIVELDQSGQAVVKVTTLIVYLHGNTKSLDSHWKEVAQKLCTTAHTAVIIHDYSNYGRSVRSSATSHCVTNVVDDAMELLKGVVQKLRPTRLVIYGKSVGAAVGLLLAQRLVNSRNKLFFQLVLETPLLGTKHLRWWSGVSWLCSEKLDCRQSLEDTSHVPMTVQFDSCDLVTNNDSILDLLHTWRKKPWTLYIDEKVNPTVSDTWTDTLTKLK